MIPRTSGRSRCRLFLAVAAALACTACSSFNPPPAGGPLGQSLREAQALHTRPPATAGASSARQATGLDGAAARAAMQRYEQSFETPARNAPVFNIGIGASSSR